VDLLPDERLDIELSRKGPPMSHALEGNYPNPFNPQTEIRFTVPEDADVLLEVYDIMGRRIAPLVNRHLEAGYHVVRFAAEDLPSGVYVYRLQAGNFTGAGRMILMK
jgi:hypothetical protein